MTTALAEQLRELAIARLIGAERRQLFLSQIILGFMISISGALIGIPLGMAMAWALILWFSDFLPAGIHPSWIAIGLSLAGAIGAGVLGSMLPAFLASRVSPMTALVTESRPPRFRGVVKCALAGLAMIAVQILLMLIPDTQAQILALQHHRHADAGRWLLSPDADALLDSRSGPGASGREDPANPPRPSEGRHQDRPLPTRSHRRCT